MKKKTTEMFVYFQVRLMFVTYLNKNEQQVYISQHFFLLLQ